MDFYKLFMNDFSPLLYQEKLKPLRNTKEKGTQMRSFFYSDSVCISKKFSVLPNGDFFLGGVKSIPAAFA